MHGTGIVARSADPTLQLELSSASSLEKTLELLNFGSLYRRNRSELHTTEVDLNIFFQQSIINLDQAS